MNQMDEAIKNGTAVFVFGSNLAGAHGAGAAAYAVKHWGARMGVGVGLTGMAYALPTKDRRINTMPLQAIRAHVLDFIKFAQLHPSMTFKVTQIGCGLAGYEAKDIAPLFIGSPSNCWFDEAWKRWLPLANFWGHVG